MERVFLRDCGRYRAGDVRDWPLPTWRGISRDWEEITRPVEEVVGEAVARQQPLPERVDLEAAGYVDRRIEKIVGETVARNSRAGRPRRRRD